MRKLILMRGLPGSGKTTEARKIAAQALGDGASTIAILSTDDYFMVDGVYRFNPERLAEYHDRNQRRCLCAMDLGVELIIIDNTNIKREHMTTYIDLARSYGYEIDECVVLEDVEKCIERNIHGVPEETIRRMAEEFER